MNLENYYNTISNSDLQKGGYWTEKIAFFEKNLSKLSKENQGNIQILDMACNDGHLSKIYSKYGKVSGIDLNKDAVNRARENGINAVFGDVLQLSSLFENKKFDVVIAGDIIEHIFDTDLFLKNINFVLKEEGVLLISTPNLVSLGRRLLSFFGKNPFCEYSSKNDGKNVGHVRYYTAKDMKKQLLENNFKKIIITSDTLNLPIKFIDRFLTKVFPKLGRELLVITKKK